MVEKNRELVLAYGEVLLEQLADGVEEAEAGNVPRLMACRGGGAKMTLVELAYGLSKAGVVCGVDGRLLTFNRLAEVLGKVCGVSLKNASQLKQDLLRRDDPGALLRKALEEVDRETDERLR